MVISGTTDLAGQMLAGRYRLLAPIGRGSSGRVYVGEDTQLGRKVAIKVLDPGLAEDAAFLRRFRAEAQTAARMHHPNVMAVYDWGQDGDVPFMVLELLTGGSLRAMLDQGVPLSPSQAAYVGHRVAAGLEYAHAQGLVHRDIKPANILFDERGEVRIADFGIARALAEASWTEPAGAMIGTARYAAPEQARGGALDGRADCYALALVIVEAVTGELPGGGETSVGLLAARLTQPVIAPLALGALGPIVERAGRPEPTDRYSDATEMADALALAAQELPEPEPLLLPGLPMGGGDPHPTQVRVEGSPILVVRDDTPERSLVSGETRRRAIPFLVGLLIVLGLGSGAFALDRAGGSQVRVPSLVGLNKQQALVAVARVGLKGKEAVPVVADDPVGVVIGQRPDSGTQVRSGGSIRLIISAGPPPVALPGVVGQPEAQARAALAAAGFELADSTHVFHEEVAKGAVISQEPSGAKAPRDSVVTLVVSDGERPVPVPSVVGKTWEEAAAKLRAARMEPVRSEQFSDTVPVGKVISHDPVAGEEAQPGSKVTVHVSKGPDLIAVPNVRGTPIEEATRKLESLGFEVDVVGYKPGRLVKRQDPSPGERVKSGSTVTLFL